MDNLVGELRQLADDLITVSPQADARESKQLLDAAAQRIEELEGIVGCVVRTLDRMDYGLDAMVATVRLARTETIDPDPLCGPTWHRVGYVCGLGSTAATALCREFGVDPSRDYGRESVLTSDPQ